MQKLAIITATVIAFGGFTAAQASSLGRPCTTAPQSQWLSVDALKAKAEAQGYKVQKAKIAKACGEIYALDPNNARTELFVDPTSGEIVVKEYFMTASKSAVGAAGAMPAAPPTRRQDCPRLGSVRPDLPLEPRGPVCPRLRDGTSEWLHIQVGYPSPLSSRCGSSGALSARHARFGDFVRSPSEIAAYSGQAIRFRAPRHLGHNPAGGAMVLAATA